LVPLVSDEDVPQVGKGLRLDHQNVFVDGLVDDGLEDLLES